MANDFANRSTHMIYETGKIGCVEIADEVVAIIAGLAATEVEGVAAMAGNVTKDLIGRFGTKNLAKGVRITMMDASVSVDLSLNIKFGYNIPQTAAAVQDKVKNAIENMTGLSVVDINVRVANIEME